MFFVGGGVFGDYHEESGHRGRCSSTAKRWMNGGRSEGGTGNYVQYDVLYLLLISFPPFPSPPPPRTSSSPSLLPPFLPCLLFRFPISSFPFLPPPFFPYLLLILTTSSFPSLLVFILSYLLFSFHYNSPFPSLLPSFPNFLFFSTCFSLSLPPHFGVT